MTTWSRATPKSHLLTLTVNGVALNVTVEASTTLAELLRERLGLTGTKVGCGVGECGACTVLVDNEPLLSCSTLAVSVSGRHVTTIEGLRSGGDLHPIQLAFARAGAVQCGYCTPGMILITKALLDKYPQPSDSQIMEYLAGNLCRCTGYSKIVEGVRLAVSLQNEA